MVRLRFIWSPGTQTSSFSFRCVRTTVTRNSRLVTSFMLSGFPIFSWSALRQMELGPLCAPMSALVWRMFMGMPLLNCIRNMRRLGRGAKRSRHVNYGFKFWMPRWRRELPICYIRMLVIKSLIKRIWEPLKVQIYAARLCSTQMRRKLRFVIWRVLGCHLL